MAILEPADKRRLSMELAKVLPFVVAATVVCWLLVLLVGFNASASMPYGFYLRIPYLGGELEVDDLVQIRNPSPGLLGVETEHLLKSVASVGRDGSLYVRGRTQDSYDSRYFGWVDRSLVEAVCLPIVTSDRLETFSGYIRFAEALAGPGEE